MSLYAFAVLALDVAMLAALVAMWLRARNRAMVRDRYLREYLRWLREDYPAILAVCNAEMLRTWGQA